MLTSWQRIPFCVILALSSADFGFLLNVKCLAGVGWLEMTFDKAVLFKYRHSPGIKLGLTGFLICSTA